MKRALILAGFALFTLAGAPPAPGKDARIPFADSHGIRDYQPDGEEAMWIEDMRGRWYRAEFLGPCRDLPYSHAIAFVTRGNGTLDKFGAVLVEGRRCQLNSLKTAAQPPGKGRQPKGK